MRDQEWRSRRKMFKATSSCCDDEENQLMIRMPITWAGTHLLHEMILTQTPVPSHLSPQDSDPTWLFKVLFLISLTFSQLGSAVSSAISFIL